MKSSMFGVKALACRVRWFFERHGAMRQLGNSVEICYRTAKFAHVRSKLVSPAHTFSLQIMDLLVDTLVRILNVEQRGMQTLKAIAEFLSRMGERHRDVFRDGYGSNSWIRNGQRFLPAKKSKV